MTFLSGPFKGLDSYAEEDSAYFFGRDDDIRLISANALTSRLTILYGPSGVGKSSLLAAGVLASFSKYTNVLPLLFRTWAVEDPLHHLKRLILDAGGATNDDPIQSASQDLSELLIATCGEHWRSVVLLLDQFDEYFVRSTYGGMCERFESELSKAINQKHCPATFLAAIREDAIGKLDRFKPRVPALFSNLLRLDHLTKESARAAILEPLRLYRQQYGEGYGPTGIERPLVEFLLETLRPLELTPGLVSGNSSDAGTTMPLGGQQKRIEPALLQIVLTRLWERERELGSAVIRQSTLAELGDLNNLIADFVNEAMCKLDERERSTAALFFDRLITPSGTKIALTQGDIEAYAHPYEENVPAVLMNLERQRLLRAVNTAGVSKWELFHDLLGTAVLNWPRLFEKEQAVKGARVVAQYALKARSRALTALQGAIVIIALVVAWSGLFQPEWDSASPRYTMGAVLIGLSAMLFYCAHRSHGVSFWRSRKLWITMSVLSMTAALISIGLYWSSLARLTISNVALVSGRGVIIGSVLTPSAQAFLSAQPSARPAEVLLSFGSSYLVWTANSIRHSALILLVSYLATLFSSLTTLFSAVQLVELSGTHRGLRRPLKLVLVGLLIVIAITILILGAREVFRWPTAFTHEPVTMASPFPSTSVTIRVLDKSGALRPRALRIRYVLMGLARDRSAVRTFSHIGSLSTELISPGNYLIWGETETGEVVTRPLRIDVGDEPVSADLLLASEASAR